jgi:hypothetical protein
MMADKQESAQKRFSIALKNHLAALQKLRDTQNELFDAEKALYDSHVGINSEYAKTWRKSCKFNATT